MSGFDLSSEPDLAQISMSLEQLALVQNRRWDRRQSWMPEAMPLVLENHRRPDPDEDRVRAAVTVTKGPDMRGQRTPTDAEHAYARGLLGLSPLESMTSGMKPLPLKLRR